MQTVTVSRTIEAAPDDVADAVADLGPFIEAAGFDQVEVEDDRVRVANDVGITEIELELAVVDAPDAALVYEQREGIFEEMETRYEIADVPAGTEVTATTDFALDVAVVGGVLDATVIKRQRRKELSAQLDWLEEVCVAGDS